MCLEKCPVCNENGVLKIPSQTETSYTCENCGKFVLHWINMLNGFNENHLASYLFYNAFFEHRYYTTFQSKEECDAENERITNQNSFKLRPIHLDPEMVESWYPKTFAERIDKILLYLSDKTPHIGQTISFNYSSALSLLFVDRKESVSKQNRASNDCNNEILYMLNYLKERLYIKYDILGDPKNYLSITLSPQGFERIDEIQRNISYGRDIFVAMKFGEDTRLLREAIREGISNAGYNAVFIDEVQHNGFITPEIMKNIRSSKCVVVELTHQNNGAYFEEGYAMGLGKEVIQLCKKETKLHFDVAQKNTLMWEKESDIVQLLKNRIQATCF